MNWLPLSLRHARSLALAACTLFGLTGCGGGGDPDTPLPPEPAIPAPVITAGPQHAQVNTGTSAVFRVAADGTPPLTYQWRRNGVPVAGATGESLTLAPATILDDAARFSVVVTGAAGRQATSADAVLTVRHLAQVAVGSFHSLALKADGSVFSWGSNTAGQLGDGTQVDRLQPAPLQANAATPLAGVAAIAAGEFRSLALLRDGSVRAWGSNSRGELGDGTRDNQSRPVPVLTAANGAPLGGVVAIAAGFKHSLALRQNGTLLAWGWFPLTLGNPTNDGQFPVNVLDHAARPVTDIAAISAGELHSLALRTDGTVLSWGRNDEGQLGDGTVNARRFAASVTDAAGQALTGIRAIAASGFASYALRADGTVLSWGLNDFGQLGDGTNNRRLSPVEVVNAQGRPLRAIQSLSAGFFHVLALDADGCVHSWGDNQVFQLGTSEVIATRSHSATVETAAGAPLCNIRSLSSGSGRDIVIDQAGGLLGWGTNAYGELGDGTTTTRRLPTRVLLPGSMF